jgi:outer membrane protein OmpA-like peptidoglycan-associated protein
MERDLAAAGHDVEVVPNTQSAKRPSYSVIVVASADDATQARAKFSEAIIVQRTGDVGVDLKTIEDQVRRPIRTEESRTIVAAGPTSTPVAAAPPAETRTLVAAKEPSPEPGAAPVAAPVAPIEAPTQPVTPPKPPVQMTTTAEKPAPETPSTPAHAVGSLDKEVYFTIGSTTLLATSKRSLDAAAKWLASNVDVQVMVEGFADPTGSPDANMALSQSRAEAVRDYLVKVGTDASRIEVSAFGDTKLKYGRVDGRNRRVAIETKK